jgi:hypothetical protein
MDVYLRVEIPLVSVIASIEATGINTDSSSLGALYFEVERKLKAIQEAVDEYALDSSVLSCPVNIHSPKDVALLLYDVLALPYPTGDNNKTNKGRSTDKASLLKLQDMHMVPLLIMEYRTLHSAHSKWLKRFWFNVSNIKYYTEFDVCTSTGRIISRNPNLQNVPKSISFYPAGQLSLMEEMQSEHVCFDVSKYTRSARVVCFHPDGEGCMKKMRIARAYIHQLTTRSIFDPVRLDVDDLNATIDSVISNTAPSQTLSSKKRKREDLQEKPLVCIYIMHVCIYI